MTADPGLETGDSREPLERLLRDLRARPEGLSEREVTRRLEVHGPNELVRRAGWDWPRQLLGQFTHPLALLLWLAAALAVLSGTVVLGLAIVAVIVLNAVLAFVQEQQAERAVEALAAYLPARATVIRDGERRTVQARDLVPGDILVVEEGDRVSADARLLSGGIEVDLSTLTGESLPAFRSAELTDVGGTLLTARDLLFSGTSCTSGQARALVFATGMRTELGRIAALSQRVGRDESPLERQAKRVAWLIAALTQNRMRVTDLWTASGPTSPDGARLGDPTLSALAASMAACSNAELSVDDPGSATGDPTEVALLRASATLGTDVSPSRRARRRLRQFHFDPARRLMSTVDQDGERRVINVKGAPE